MVLLLLSVLINSEMGILMHRKRTMTKEKKRGGGGGGGGGGGIKKRKEKKKLVQMRVSYLLKYHNKISRKKYVLLYYLTHAIFLYC